MGTRSTIAIEYADGTVQQVYCHWDGYLSNNGKILAEHYSDPFKLRELIDLGDLSSLRPTIGIQHPFSSFQLETKEERDAHEKLVENMCTFYGRDRNEKCPAKTFKSYADYVANHQYEEFEYILRNVNGKATWFVADHSDNYVTLEEAFLKEGEYA